MHDDSIEKDDERDKKSKERTRQGYLHFLMIANDGLFLSHPKLQFRPSYLVGVQPT